MRNHFLTIFLAVLLSASCSTKESEVHMIRPHEELPQEIARDKSFTRVFLAGTIDMGNSRDWQKEIHGTFSKTGGRYILFNPRQEHWDATRPGEMDYQVRWELDHLEEADMLEMGLHAKGGKMVVICEKDFYRYDNVRITCEYYNVPMYDDLDDFFKSNTFKR